MRFLLRPGWIALTLAVIAFAFGCYYLLAPWQFHRSTERDGNNEALVRAVSTPAVPRSSLVAPGAEPGPAAAWRQVVVTGTYEPAGQVLARLRSVNSDAATEILTPLRTTDGQTLLVDRGYVTPNGETLPPIAPPPAGVVAVVGYQRPDESATDRAPVTEAGYRQVYAVDAAQIGPLVGMPLAPGYVQLLPGQPGVVTAVPLPPPDPNPSYSYAWQWLIFGVMAIGGWFYFVRLEYRTRRAEAEGPDAEAVPVPDDAPAPDRAGRDAPAEPAPARPTSEVLADRYGR
ncbi:SURF1 family cytochrome oxidase biogenesis protein [Actinomycetospora sp. TBRC 11914]|uniref:SURF1 family cytochrome oxidase biogenesis protein n=1 Tax=Actinomycetospora sp. TBRC 11914 TaxID=2729387 RepID=UPI00145F4378|nr:SURF1 family cytochrome oxidase biogenesis protein [Actinomycetospora sp. TBRC 11914]NMO90526.1 SURF1 family protein [Actinomycetospora sp. TBRC 11914]